MEQGSQLHPMPSFVLRSSDALFLEWHMQFTRPHLVHPRAYGLVTPLPEAWRGSRHQRQP